MTTKRLLVPIDLARPDGNQKGFIYPNPVDGIVANFKSIGSGKTWEFGLVVYVGTEIDTLRFAAKIEDSGGRVDHELMNILSRFIAQVSALKIGDVVGVEGTADKFVLTRQKKPALSTRPKLP